MTNPTRFGVSFVLGALLAAAALYLLRDSFSGAGGGPESTWIMLEGGRRIRVTAEEFRKLQAEVKEAKEDLAKSKREISDIEKDLENARREAAVLRGQVKELQSAAAAAGTTTPPEVSTLTPEEREKRLRILVNSADWRAYGQAVARWVLGEEQSRQTGQPFEPSNDDLLTLSMLNSTIMESAKILGLKNPFDAYKNPVVSEKFMPAYLEGLGLAFNDQQRDQLTNVLRQQAARDEALSLSDTKLGSLERTLQEARDSAQFDADLARILTREQAEAYARTVGSNAFFGMQVKRQAVPSDLAQATNAVTGLWVKSFGFDENQQRTASAAAEQYVREANLARDQFAVQFGRQLPRDRAMALQLHLLELQIEAERALLERLSLPPEQAERVREGSGAVVTFPEE